MTSLDWGKTFYYIQFCNIPLLSYWHISLWNLLEFWLKKKHFALAHMFIHKICTLLVLNLHKKRPFHCIVYFLYMGVSEKCLCIHKSAIYWIYIGTAFFIELYCSEINWTTFKAWRWCCHGHQQPNVSTLCSTSNHGWDNPRNTIWLRLLHTFIFNEENWTFLHFVCMNKYAHKNV